MYPLISNQLEHIQEIAKDNEYTVGNHNLYAYIFKLAWTNETKEYAHIPIFTYRTLYLCTQLV